MSLNVYLGPVNSGKTTALLDEASRVHALNLKGLYINSTIDTRNTEVVSTHNPIISLREKLGNVTFIKVSHLSDLNISEYDVIHIDEGQFFDDLVPSVRRFLEVDRKYVRVAGLSGDFRCSKFGGMLELLPLCDPKNIFFKSSYCTRCALERRLVDAPFSHRLNREERSQIAVGKKYESLCPEHYSQVNA